MMTIMGIKAESMSIDLSGMTAKVTKLMTENLRRIAEITVKITVPLVLDKKTQKLLEAATHTCPVSQSLHKETKQNIFFYYQSD